ncbi:ATP-binding protein [Poriferisphaera sp. WC338]|uniref:ATP-binding protein n=1 Tax=Poriferisphaera sp. WC338 TaxID=3425129 RepID=UPI003D818EF2
MSSLKWLSFGIGAVSSVVIMLLVLLISEAGGSLAMSNLPMMLIGALVGGFVIGLIHWIFMDQLEKETANAANHVEQLCHGKALPGEYQGRFGLGVVLEVIEQTLSSMSQRQEELVTKRKELDIRLRLAEAEQKHLTSILDSLNDAVVVTDTFNEVALANAAAEELFHFNLDKARQSPVDHVINDSALTTLIKDTREGNRAVRKRRLEQRIQQAGREAIFDVTLSCVKEKMSSQTESSVALSDESASGVVTILRDITREREIAETKSDFVSNVSHELRTPLSSIKAYMEMLIDGEAQDDQTRAEFYNIIQGETNRLSRLIDNILNISRIESGIVRVQREHISLSAVIKEAVGIMLPQARAKQIELVEVPNPDYFQVFADRDMILQCALNLFSNAIKYTDVGGRVSVSVGVNEGARMVTVAVSDTGVGVPDSDKPHLFDKFYRVADHKNLAKGTGLGLNLVKHVVETVHGGEVGVESKVDKGSTFTFALPIADNG